MLKETTVSIPGYYTKTHHIKVPALPATTFEWSKIREQYIYGSAEEREAVAHLMIYCSTAIRADFTPTNTAAYYREQKKALTEYFGYSNKLSVLFRPGFDDTTWDNFIYNEIANLRPVIYSGQVDDKEDSEGHSFVLHGYDGKGYYAVNWGWGGDYDGYYMLHIKSPANNHLFNQFAMIGIMPDNSEKPETSICETVKDTRQMRAYDLNGRQINRNVKNKLVIMREADGSTKKIMIH